MATYVLQKLFFDLEEADITAIRDNALSVLTSGGGKTLLSWSVNGSAFTKGFVPGLSPAEIILECNEALKFLSGSRVTTTYSDFNRSGLL